jgi:hypothetical protein
MLMLHIWATSLYNYYVQLAIDVTLFALWICALVVEVMQTPLNSKQNAVVESLHTSVPGQLNPALVTLISLES